MKVRTNSGKVYNVTFHAKGDESKNTVNVEGESVRTKYSYYVYAISEEHARQIVEAYDEEAEIVSIEEENEAISQHYGLALDSYQIKAMTTCMPSSANVAYMFLNLVGEVGETAEKMAEGMTDKAWIKALVKLSKTLEPFGATAKSIRKDPENIMAADIRAAFARLTFLPEEQKQELQKELGDIMWQLNGLITMMTSEEVAQQNLDKLASRQERNQIDGNGDNR